MAIRLPNGKYKCGYCGKVFAKDQEADTCKQSHDLVYLALTTDDINRLHNFLYFKDDTLLTESLLNQVKKAVRAATVRV